MTTDTAFWNGLAEKYSRQPVANPEAFDRKIAETTAKLTPQAVVLDIGCGTGSLALRLAPRAAHVHGLDLSSEMVRIAREKASAQGVDNVTFHVGGLDGELPFESESLDCVCAYSLLHLVADRDAALRRIHALVKPGGCLVASTICLADSWVPYTPLLRVMKWLGKAPTVKVFAKRRLCAEIQRAGFVDLVEPDVGADSKISFIVATKPRVPAPA